MNSTKLSYRPDIDGLRAIAVLAVIANHLPQAFLSSGFLGVDVFFVISGFVVTATILNQNQSGFTGFYANFLSRRVKRLLPALIVCVAITSIAVLFIDPFPRVSILTGISALFGVSNIALVNFEQDYFSAPSKFNAFTHTWSLGVEEQFYLVFPLIAWATMYGKWRQSASVFIACMALLTVMSLASFLGVYEVSDVVAYYFMPTRFWELGVGVLVLLATRKYSAMRTDRIVAFASRIVLTALVLCFFLPQEWAKQSTPVAVGLTALLLFNASHNASTRLLAFAPVVYFGKISYSLYLWHWPVVSLGALTFSASGRISALYVTTMLVAAILSYHFVERPLRVSSWSSSKVRDIGIGFTGSFLVAVSAYFALSALDTFVSSDDATLHPPPRLPLLNSGLPYITCVVDEQRPLTPQTFDQCTFPPKPGSGMPTIWAIGDSHVAHLQGLLYELHRIAGFGVHLIGSVGHVFPAGHEGDYAPLQLVFSKILDKSKPGDIVLISRLYLTRSKPTTVHRDLPLWLDRVDKLAKDLATRGVTLVIPGPPPMFNFADIRECDIALRDCTVARADLIAVTDSVMQQLYALQSANENVLVFDTFAHTCPSTGQFCYPDNGTSFLFRDRDHFNSLGSKRLAEPFMKFLQASGISPAP